MKRLGSFVVAEDGALSFHGQNTFNVYSSEGRVSVISFRLEGDNVIETRTAVAGPDLPTQRTYPFAVLQRATEYELQLVKPTA